MIHSSYVHRIVNLMDSSKNVCSIWTLRKRSVESPRVRPSKSRRSTDNSPSAQSRQDSLDGQDDRSFDAVLLGQTSRGAMSVCRRAYGRASGSLAEEGLDDQFHPSYTRMVPAHHLMRVELVGCPDPNPVYQRFFEPARNTLPMTSRALARDTSASYQKRSIAGWIVFRSRLPSAFCFRAVSTAARSS